MPTANVDCYWVRNTEKSLRRLRAATKGVAVLPLASIESHGPHLPLGSDLLCTDHIMAAVLRDVTVAVLPTLAYTCVTAARMLPGAIHVMSSVLMDQVETICDEVARNGFEKVVLFQGHGGNVFVDSAFVRRILERNKPYVVYSIPVFAGKGEDLAALCESDDLGHACELETSMCLAACPDLVALKALGKKTFPSQPGLDVGCAHTSADWIARHPEMAVGRPRLATREKGVRAFEIWVAGVVDCLKRVKRDTVTRGVLQDYVRKMEAVGRPSR